MIGLCIVVGLITLFLCFHQQRQKKKSKNGSMDTLKTSSDHCHSIPSVRVSDTSSSVNYPMNQTRTIYYNDETTGIYSIQGKYNQ
jgi:plastocyanin domain-containing protein